MAGPGVTFLARQAAILAAWTDDPAETWIGRLKPAETLCLFSSSVTLSNGPAPTHYPLALTDPQACAETLIARDLLPMDAFDGTRGFACSWRGAGHARCVCGLCKLERHKPKPIPRDLWMLFGWACQDFGSILQAEALAQVIAQETYKKTATIEWYIEMKGGGETQLAATRLWMLTPDRKGRLFDLGVTVRDTGTTDPHSVAERELAALGFPIRLVSTPKYPEGVAAPVIQLLCEAPCIAA